MYVLRIEHAVPDFEGWKRAFDDDPIGREKFHVRTHRVFRSVEDPKYALIDLEFDTVTQAEVMLEELRTLWGKVEVMREPRARIVEVIETRAYRS